MYELNLRSDNDLNCILGRPDNTGNSGILDCLLINKGVVLDLCTKSCCTVVNFNDVVFSAKSCKNALSDCCEVVICKLELLFFLILVICSSWSLKVELGDNETEYEVVDNCEYKADRNKELRVNSHRSLEAKDVVNKSC